jgi:hypothetical protein
MIISQVNAKLRIDRDILTVVMEFLLIVLLYENKNRHHSRDEKCARIQRPTSEIFLLELDNSLGYFSFDFAASAGLSNAG